MWQSAHSSGQSAVFSLGSRVPVWGAWAPGPVYRGLCATSPRWPHLPTVPAATGHTVNVASITRRHADLARWLWDLSKMALPGSLALWHR